MNKQRSELNIMSDYVGGYLLFEPGQSGEALIAAIFKAMELRVDASDVRLPDEEGVPRFVRDVYPLRREATLELSLAILAKIASGVIEAKGPEQYETYWFEPPVDSYPVTVIWVPDAVMYDNAPPEYREAFIPRWLELCEQGKAVFGYFSPFEHMFYRDFIDERLLPALESGDLRRILKENEACWLIYLGPELAQRWRQEQVPLLFPVVVSQELPSGAHFFRTRTGVMA